ncbi:MAG TPA: signal peptidase II [Vicinamibacterales bacterium]|nr:signal peptidase II [Vicinamibacterales bacterium]
MLPEAAEAQPGSPTPVPFVVTPAAGRVRHFWWLTIGLIVADQVTKALVNSALGLYDSTTVIPGFLDLVHVRNEGVAFGLLNSTNLPYKAAITTALALAALGGIALYARQLQPREWVARLGLACILGGAVGNLIDRVRQGYVLDFVDVYWNTWHFWAFNVADASITIGAILVFVDLLLVKHHASDPV